MRTRYARIFVLSLLSALPILGQQAQAQTSARPYVKDPRFWPTPVMDTVPPVLPALRGRDAVLIFSKTNGFRDTPQILAANAALQSLVRATGRRAVVSENGAIFNPDQLRHFGTVVFNSTSGNILTDDQRAAFKQWLEAGAGFVALHGAGGDHHYDWRWYADAVLGTQFIGHTSKPYQFQQALIRIVQPAHPTMASLPRTWSREDEWYAFDRVPSGSGTQILATLDEDSYSPVSEQRMGVHPIIWTRCIGRGRVFFSALGHKAETYAEPLHLRMIRNALRWAGAARRKGCA